MKQNTIYNRLLFWGILLICTQGYSQIKYSVKAEVGFLEYQKRLVDVSPGLGWKGHYLYDENGINFRVINGVNFKNKLFAGVGVGYLNFEGMNGVSIFSDFEYLPLKTRLSPLVGLKIGYVHLWNQYKNGTGTELAELCLGLDYKLTNKIAIYAKAGFSVAQESLLLPVIVGVRF